MDKEYKYSNSSRGFITIFSIAFLTLISIISFLSHSVIFNIIGVVLAFVILRAILSAIRKDEWKIWISEKFIKWDYSRWPKTEGKIEIENIKKLVIDDCAGKLRITMKDEETLNLRLMAPAGDVFRFFKENFNSLEVEFIKGT